MRNYENETVSVVIPTCNRPQYLMCSFIPVATLKDMDCEGGAPVVLLDAQATGMPVISTTHCDIPDEVVHGETGLLSPEKDVGALAELIKKV